MSQTPELGPVRRVRVRRAPRYQAFIGAGVLVGVVVALVSGLAGQVDPDVGRAKLLLYLLIAFGLIGAMLGGLVAVLLERQGRRGR